MKHVISLHKIFPFTSWCQLKYFSVGGGGGGGIGGWNPVGQYDSTNQMGFVINNNKQIYQTNIMYLFNSQIITMVNQVRSFIDSHQIVCAGPFLYAHVQEVNIPFLLFILHIRLASLKVLLQNINDFVFTNFLQTW